MSQAREAGGRLAPEIAGGDEARSLAQAKRGARPQKREAVGRLAPEIAGGDEARSLAQAKRGARPQKDKLVKWLGERSPTRHHELIEVMLAELGRRGTIECTVSEIGHWMERHNLCADYRDVLDSEV